MPLTKITKPPICCVCKRDLTTSDYMMIDGMRRWCVPCGQITLGRYPFNHASQRKYETNV